MFHLNICSTTATARHRPTHAQPDLYRVHHLAAADRYQAALSIYLPPYTSSSPSFDSFRKPRATAGHHRSAISFSSCHLSSLPSEVISGTTFTRRASLVKFFQISQGRKDILGPCGEPCHSSNSFKLVHRPIPPQLNRLFCILSTTGPTTVQARLYFSPP